MLSQQYARYLFLVHAQETRPNTHPQNPNHHEEALQGRQQSDIKCLADQLSANHAENHSHSLEKQPKQSVSVAT